MDIHDFLAGARKHLIVDWLLITPREGRRIDVGEEFDVEVSVRNAFDADSSVGFTDIELQITGTTYAAPTGEGRLSVDGRLGPGERFSRVVRFRALASDPATEGGLEREPVGEVWARARLDLDAISLVETDPRLIRAQIYGGGPPE
jgi:hypothetical protein